MRLNSLIVPFLALSLALSAPVQAAHKVDLKIGILPIEDALPFLVLEDEETLPGLQIVSFRSALERDAALEAGQIDGCVMDPLAAAIMRGRGMDVVISSLVLGSSPREGRFALLGAPGSGLTDPKQLQGVPIAVSSATIIEYVTDSLLVDGGLAPGDIVKQEVKQIPIRFQMLMAGQVKAATLPDPLAVLAETQGASLIMDDTKGEKNLSQVVLVFPRKTLREKTVDVEALYQVYDPAVERINTDPARYRDLLVRKGGLPKPIAEVYKIARFPAAQLPDKVSIEHLLAWARKKGLLAQPVAYQDLVEGSFLR